MEESSKVFSAICLILSIVLGMIFAVQLDTPIYNDPNVYLSREIISRLNNEKQELQKSEDRLKSLAGEYKKLQKKTNVDTDLLSKEEYESYRDHRMILGQEYIEGEGVVITIAPKDTDKNIAFEFDSERILLKMVNLSKRKGGEIVAINDQLILHNTGIVLAGNHININNVPITPPYEIKVLGNEKKLHRFFTQESVFVLTLEKNLDVTTEVVRSRDIQIPKGLSLKETQYIREAR
ncbi:MAG: DUF881 domain-containing protein [Peptostreptococcaceae bacterium]|nr:DUF881 domain-containing protein [Peptostreptococcaceae bacterium]